MMHSRMLSLRVSGNCSVCVDEMDGEGGGCACVGNKIVQGELVILPPPRIIYSFISFVSLPPPPPSPLLLWDDQMTTILDLYVHEFSYLDI